jgi:DNA-binding transcriptional LysR family regulator
MMKIANSRHHRAMKADTHAALASLDMNLLRVLDTLMQERKVAPAAVRLGLSQPAVSNALARLRHALGDELLTRSAQGMQPTAYALAVHAALGPALATIDGALRTKELFNPLTSVWSARLAMTDIGEIVFLPPLLYHLRRAAPGLTLSTVRDAPGGLNAAMAEGAVDLALGWLPDVPQGFYQRRLFTQRYVCLMRAGHPLAKGASSGKFTLAKFLSAEHVAIHAEGTGHAKANAKLQTLDKSAAAERKVAVQVPSFLSVPYLLASSDFIATVPERLALEACKPFGLTALAHPVAMPDFQVKLFWHRRVHQDAANQWLREWLGQFFTDVNSTKR